MPNNTPFVGTSPSSKNEIRSFHTDSKIEAGEFVKIDATEKVAVANVLATDIIFGVATEEFYVDGLGNNKQEIIVHGEAYSLKSPETFTLKGRATLMESKSLQKYDNTPVNGFKVYLG